MSHCRGWDVRGVPARRRRITVSHELLDDTNQVFAQVVCQCRETCEGSAKATRGERRRALHWRVQGMRIASAPAEPRCALALGGAGGVVRCVSMVCAHRPARTASLVQNHFEVVRCVRVDGWEHASMLKMVSVVVSEVVLAARELSLPQERPFLTRISDASQLCSLGINLPPCVTPLPSNLSGASVGSA